MATRPHSNRGQVLQCGDTPLGMADQRSDGSDALRGGFRIECKVGRVSTRAESLEGGGYLRSGRASNLIPTSLKGVRAALVLDEGQRPTSTSLTRFGVSRSPSSTYGNSRRASSACRSLLYRTTQSQAIDGETDGTFLYRRNAHFLQWGSASCSQLPHLRSTWIDSLAWDLGDPDSGPADPNPNPSPPAVVGTLASTSCYPIFDPNKGPMTTQSASWPHQFSGPDALARAIVQGPSATPNRQETRRAPSSWRSTNSMSHSRASLGRDEGELDPARDA